MIGQRLKVARRAAGFSLRSLAKEIEYRVSAQAIGKYERDESGPNSEVLIALSDALNVSIDFLLSKPGIELEAVEFKKNEKTNKHEMAMLEARTLHFVERYLFVEELLGLGSIDWRKPLVFPYPVLNNMTETEIAAKYVRNYWGLGTVPIFNLVESLEQRGVKVLSFDLNNVDGLSARVRRTEKNSIPVFAVNQNHSGERQRFSLAYELGHLVLDVSSKLDQEKAAHRFAGAFLMPAESLWIEVGRNRSDIDISELLYLKQIFGVSIHEVTQRLRELGIIKEALFRRLLDRYKRLGWRTAQFNETCAMNGETPTRFKRLAFRAYAEETISLSRLAELLDVSVWELYGQSDDQLKNET